MPVYDGELSVTNVYDGEMDNTERIDVMPIRTYYDEDTATITMVLEWGGTFNEETNILTTELLP